MEKLGPTDPKQIGVYRLLGRLGAGGMGQVYLARSDRGRTVAVKLVREELAEQEEFRGRFRREVEAARRVGGLWTAPVLDADTEAAIPWVATGYVAGPSLQTVVGHEHGPLPERSVRILAAGLTHALKDIHAAGLIHRDLKPSNVLVTIDGPRVIDFGIARALETVTDGGLTRTGALVGSPGFMAPEQVRGDAITPACDIFCLGSVLSYAATGALPFGAAGSGVHALMFRIAQEEPDLDELPESLQDLVRACLAKDPAERPSLDELLRRVGAGETVLDGRALEPWLPGMLVAQLGRHAVQLLDSEDPEAGPDPTPGEAEGKREGGSGAGTGTPPPPGTPSDTPPALDRLPTMAAGPGSTPPPTPAPAPQNPPAYGYPHAQPGPGYGYPHAQPGSAYGYPQGQSGGYGHPQGGDPGHGPAGAQQPPGPAFTTGGWHDQQHTPPYGPPPQPRRSGRATALLLVVAVLVAIGAGGSVYAVMKGDDPNQKNNRGDKPAATSSAPVDPPTSGPTTSEPPTSSEPPTTPPADEDAIPEQFLGTWSASFETDGDTNTRVMTLVQGEEGQTVMTLFGASPTYDCEWTAPLRSAGSSDLVLGPSTVIQGSTESCKPGPVSRVTMADDGTLVRELIGTKGEPLHYTKS